MPKLLTDRDMLDIVQRTLTDPGCIDDGDQYEAFLGGLSKLIADHFGGVAGDVQRPNDVQPEWVVPFVLDENVPPDGGEYARYDPEVTWEAGEEQESVCTDVTEDYYIVNDVDRPNEELLAQRRPVADGEHALFYVRTDIGTIRIGMSMRNATNVAEFGLKLTQCGGVLRGRIVGPSVARYARDGRPRSWQGSHAFRIQLAQK